MQDEFEKFEAGLRRVSPTAPPPELMERLRTAVAEAQPAGRKTNSWSFRWANPFASWRGPATFVSAAAAAMVLLWLTWHPSAGESKATAAESTGIKANAVQVGHSLLASFDTIAQVPGGEPVRFRCREWQDDVVVHDDAHGLVISKSTPRVEIVPVRFEVY